MFFADDENEDEIILCYTPEANEIKNQKHVAFLVYLPRGHATPMSTVDLTQSESRSAKYCHFVYVRFVFVCRKYGLVESDAHCILRIPVG